MMTGLNLNPWICTRVAGVKRLAIPLRHPSVSFSLFYRSEFVHINIIPKVFHHPGYMVVFTHAKSLLSFDVQIVNGKSCNAIIILLPIFSKIHSRG